MTSCWVESSFQKLGIRRFNRKINVIKADFPQYVRNTLNEEPASKTKPTALHANSHGLTKAATFADDEEAEIEDTTKEPDHDKMKREGKLFVLDACRKAVEENDVQSQGPGRSKDPE